MAEIIDSDSELEALSAGSPFHQRQLATEMFRQRIRRDARRLLEEEERTQAGASFDGNLGLVYDPLPFDTPELMPGILPESGTAAIVGETETGKSLIAIEIASSLLTGEPLWEVIKPTRRIEKVVYVLGEHTVATLQGLYHRTKLPHAGDFRIIGPEHLHPYKALVAAGVQQPIAVEKMLKWTEGANLIVFDPLAGFVQGQQGEQDNSTMRTLIDTMSYIADRQKAACLILSHMGKPKMDDQGAEVRRTSYAMRGASSQEDALTHVFYLRKRTLTKKGAMPQYELSVRKFKGNPSNDVFLLERNPETMRNSLITAAQSTKGRDYISREERDVFYRQVANLGEAKGGEKRGWGRDHCIEIVAAANNIPLATVKRWEGDD